MADKRKPITFRLFYNGQEVDKLPPEAVEKNNERLSKAFEKYCREHPGTLEWLEERGYAIVTRYDAAGNPI